MKLAEQIHEERHRFETFYGRKPDSVYLGYDQIAEIDAMVEELRKFNMIVQAESRQEETFMGMRVLRVKAQSHLGFGLEQPSPCG